VRLRIKIDQKDLALLKSEAGSEIDRSGGLAASALLVHNRIRSHSHRLQRMLCPNRAPRPALRSALRAIAQ
jgi:hypothetical protein